MSPATLRAAAAVIEAAAIRHGYPHWLLLASALDDLADDITPEPTEETTR